MISSTLVLPLGGPSNFSFCCVVFLLQGTALWKVSQDFAWVLLFFASSVLSEKHPPLLTGPILIFVRYWLCYAVASVGID
jgi:hypothetical protein